MTAPVIDQAGSLFAVGLRLTRLAADGSPLTGAGNAYTTTALATISAGIEYNDAEEVTQPSGSGGICLYYQAPATVKQGTISDFTICTPDPLIKSFVIGGDVITTTGNAEVQTVTITGSPTGGTFTLTYAGQTTATIVYNAAAGAVQSALEALSNVEVGDVTVSGSAGGPYTLTFAAALGNVPQVTANGAALTGGTTPGVTVATTTQGLAPSVIGYRAPRVGVAPTPNGVSLEVWTQAIENGGAAASLPYWHWVFPRAQLRLSGNLTAAADAAMTPTFEGTTNENANWGAGPVGDWPYPSDRIWQYARVAEVPDLSAGPITVTG